MVVGDGNVVQAVFNGGGDDVRSCSSSKKMTGSFIAGSLASSQPSIEASDDGRWHAMVAARVLGLHSLRDKI
jgi:hypothetical protein